MVGAHCLRTCQPVFDNRAISLCISLFFEDSRKAQERTYLETCEKQASNKTYINSLLTLAHRLDQMLDSLIVLFKSKATFSFVPYGTHNGPVSSFETLM